MQNLQEIWARQRQKGMQTGVQIVVKPTKESTAPRQTKSVFIEVGVISVITEDVQSIKQSKGVNLNRC